MSCVSWSRARLWIEVVSFSFFRASNSDLSFRFSRLRASISILPLAISVVIFISNEDSSYTFSEFYGLGDKLLLS